MGRVGGGAGGVPAGDGGGWSAAVAGEVAGGGVGVEGGEVFLLGADAFGRCLLSRTLVGSQVSLTVGVVGVAISFVIGIVVGGVSGYYAGILDMLIQRLIEAGQDLLVHVRPFIEEAAEQAGVQMVTVHGRTREQGYTGMAEYDTIAAVKAALRIPVVANGDIDSPHKALQVLQRTGADALMIGRAAQGRPWIFREIDHYLRTGKVLAPPTVSEVRERMAQHLEAHYAFYGDYLGVRTARKHVGWYLGNQPGAMAFLRETLYPIESPEDQLAAIDQWFAAADGYASSRHTASIEGLSQ